MTEDHQFRSGQTLTFASGKPRFRAILLFGFIALLAIVAVTSGNLRTVAPPGNAAGLVAVFIFFASMLFLTITRQWTAEIDLDTRRLRIFRRSSAAGSAKSLIARSMNAVRLERSNTTTTVIFLTACTCD